MSKTICVCGRKGPKYPECCDSDGNFLPGHGPRADRMSDPKPLTTEEAIHSLLAEVQSLCPDCRSPKQTGTRHGYRCEPHRTQYILALDAERAARPDGLREAAKAVVDHRRGAHGVVAFSCGLRLDDHIDALRAALAAPAPAPDAEP